MRTISDVKWESVRNTAKKVRAFIIHKYGDTDGFCLTASRYIKKLLEFKGINSTMIEGDVKLNVEPGCLFSTGFHFWLEVEGIIVDVTADQFNDEKNHFLDIIIATYTEKPEYLKKEAFEGDPWKDYSDIYKIPDEVLELASVE